jgi:hypothetical protein
MSTVTTITALNRCLGTALISCCAMLHTAAQAQSWTWQNHEYYTLASSKQRVSNLPGYVTMNDINGTSTVQFFAGRVDKCTEQPMQAEITKTDTQTVITATPPAAGCAPIRLTVKNNGTGASRETMVNGKWVADAKNNALRLSAAR